MDDSEYDDDPFSNLLDQKFMEASGRYPRTFYEERRESLFDVYRRARRLGLSEEDRRALFKVWQSMGELITSATFHGVYAEIVDEARRAAVRVGNAEQANASMRSILRVPKANVATDRMLLEWWRDLQAYPYVVWVHDYLGLYPDSHDPNSATPDSIRIGKGLSPEACLIRIAEVVGRTPAAVWTRLDRAITQAQAAGDSFGDLDLPPKPRETAKKPQPPMSQDS